MDVNKCKYVTTQCGRITHICFSNTPFTQGLRPLCLPCATTKLARSPLKAEERPHGCLGRSRVAHRMFRHRHGCHGRREVLSMFKTVAQRSPRRSVAHRSLKGGRMKAHTSPWSQNGCTVVGHWLPSKKCEHCVSIWATRLPSLYHHCASFGQPMASIERSLWRPLCLNSATTATLEPPWQWFCLHSAFFTWPVVPLQQLWSFKEGTRVVLQQLHRNRTFWVPATTERLNNFYGRTKVARRLQPCVKGALMKPLLVQMTCRLFGAKPLSETMKGYCQHPREQISMELYLKLKSPHSGKCIWKWHVRNGVSFVPGSMS